MQYWNWQVAFMWKKYKNLFFNELLHLRWNVSHTPIPPRFLHMQKLADRVIAIAELLDEIGERPKAVLFVHFVAQDIF